MKLSDHLDNLFWSACILFVAALLAVAAAAAPITVGAVISGWNVKTPQNPGGYTQSPYAADGVTLTIDAQRVITALAPPGGVIRYTGAQQTQGSPETSPLNRSPNNLDPRGITWEGISAIANYTHTSPWIAIPQGAYANAGTVNSDAYQMGLNMAQRLDPRIPDVWVEYSNELWNGGDQLNGTANLFRARLDPRLTATDDNGRMAQEAGLTFGEVVSDYRAGFLAGGGKAKVHGVFGGFIANSYWASNALSFLKQKMPSYDLSGDRLAVAPYAPGSPSDIGGIQPGDTAASIIARSTAFAQQYFPGWIGSNKAVADAFGMKGLAFYETDAGATYDFTSGTNVLADMNRSDPQMRPFVNWFLNFVSDLADGKLDGKNADPGALLEIFGTASGVAYNNVNQFPPLEFYNSDSPKYEGFLDFSKANAVNVDPYAVPEPSLLAVLAFVGAIRIAGRRKRKLA